jgi:paraquat-inducible protein B
LNIEKIMALTEAYRKLETQRQEILRQIHRAIKERKTTMATPKKKLKGLKATNTPPGGRTPKRRSRTKTRKTNITTTTSAGSTGEGMV